MPPKLCCLIVLALPLCFEPALAGATETPQTIQLQLRPKAEPRYALQYLFETPYMKQRPGNAALLYPAAATQLTQVLNDETTPNSATLSQWCDMPLDELPVDEVRPAVERFDRALGRLDLASRCEWCLWESPVREEGFGYLMPHLGDYRQLGRVVSLKARVQIRDGQVEEAIDTVRMGITMARDIAKGPSLIENLVGVAISTQMARVIEDLIQAPDGPNLYWALTVLPDPLIDMRVAIQMETDILYAEIPALERIETEVLSNEEAAAIWKQSMAFLSSTDDQPDKLLARTAGLVGGALMIYPKAKARLIEQGRDPKEVESWPPIYVVLLDQFQQYRTIRDMQFKWMYLPYLQARDGFARAEEYMSQHSSGRYDLDVAINPFLAMLPAIGRITFLKARLRRDYAILRTIEAIRMYAADHDGALPKSLDDITAVPIPRDPLRGEPFIYKVTGSKATLESPVPPDGRSKDGRRYEITMR